MPLRDADVKKTFWELRLKALRPGAAGHRSRNRDNPAVLLGIPAQEFPHPVGKADTDGRKLPRIGIEGPDAVIFIRVRFGVGTAFSLPCQHVEKHRLPQFPGKPDGIFKLVDVMTVHGSQIVKAHVAEHIARQEPGFELLLGFVDKIIDPARMPGSAAKPFLEIEISGLDPHGL